MAPVQVDHEPRLMPLLLAISRVAAAAYASYTVAQSHYRSHKALGPAQYTRHRKAERTKLTVAFASVAALGLVFAVSSGWDYLTLSYRVWASERGIDVPGSFWGNRTLGTNATDEARLHLRRWLSDTPVYLDALEIVAEKARRLWWGQQVDLATISWTAVLAIEGRRRRIPHLWAYALLPHLVSLSFAQNLFYVALLQTPSPIRFPETRAAQLLHRLLPAKPQNWFPNISLLVFPLILNYLAALWLPLTAGTPSFPTAIAATKLLTLAPLVLPAIAPASWGTVHADPRGTYPGITKIFNVISAASALIHAKTTVSALLYNLPGSYKHRHSIKIPFDTEKRSRWERTATAVEKVLGSLTDHPAVAAAGKDALLCALSLGLWAAVRSTDVSDMLCALWRRSPSAPPAQEEKESAPSQNAKAEPAHEDEEPTSTPGPGLSMTLRRRGRHKRDASGSSVDGPGAPAPDPVPAPTPRRRGRPRKHKPEPEPANGRAPDATYVPTPAVKAETGLGDVVPEEGFDWDPAALAWALTAVGGLGLSCAAVFGAECVSR